MPRAAATDEKPPTDADSRRIEYVERGELATVKVAELRLRKARMQLATS